MPPSDLQDPGPPVDDIASTSNGKPSTTPTLRWTRWLLALCALVAAVVAVDVATGTYAIGATMRLLWNGLAFALLWATRSVQGLVALIARRRAWRATSVLTAIGFGYMGRVFLSAPRIREAHGWREKFRIATARLRRWWAGLATGMKFAVVAVLIVAQLAILPTAAEYLVLFPVGFMIPVIASGIRKLYSWAGDLVFARMYWQYCGRAHNAAVRACGRLMPVRATSRAVRLLRLRYLTAWRLWKYDPRYRDESGELWVSFLEPVRLWRTGKLDIYIGHPLLSGARRGSESIAA